MRVVALSAGRWRWVTERSAGVVPWCWPPAREREAMFALEDALEGADFLYVNLDGVEGQPYWYGDGLVTAIAGDWLAGLDLRGLVAYVTACYSVETGPGRAGTPAPTVFVPGPMVGALLSAGCAAVIGGDGPNYGGTWEAQGVDTLGLWLRRGLSWHLSVDKAFLLARAAIAPVALLRREERDALGFRLFGDGSAFGDRRRNARRGAGRIGTPAPTDGAALVTRGGDVRSSDVPKMVGGR